MGEKIPHSEKVFSIFEEHTEWISKGKAGVPVELGIKVCIMEDQYGFILHHHVMQKQEDAEITVMMVEETRKRFDHFNQCSFDKGFSSDENKKKLPEGFVGIIPKKGNLSKAECELERTPGFKAARNQHSAVESAINSLEHHGLDVCPDSGIKGFKRYVALAVTGQNIARIGRIRLEREKKRNKTKKAA